MPTDKKPSDLTLEDLKAMNTSELGKLVEGATLAHSHKRLMLGIDVLTEDTKLGLDDITPGFTTPPVPVPLGVLEGRDDLGLLGIMIEVRHTLVNLEEFKAANPRKG